MVSTYPILMSCVKKEAAFSELKNKSLMSISMEAETHENEDILKRLNHGSEYHKK